MTSVPGQDLSGLSDPALAALLLCVDPFGLGGLSLRSRAGPFRDRWLAELRGLMPHAPLRRLPLHAGDGRLFGGLDLAATLSAGRPVAERGILAEADGELLLLAMAERMPGTMAARLGAVLDTGEVILERDGLNGRSPARVGMVALDEGIDEEERPPPALLERLGFWIDLDGFDPSVALARHRAALAEARRLYATVEAGEAILSALAGTAAALGIASLRPVVQAVRAARAAAALEGRVTVEDRDAALAARLVLAPRATRLPVDPAAEPTADPPPPADPDQNADAGPQPHGPSEQDDPDRMSRADQALGDIVLEAAKAAIPPGLLMRLQTAAALRTGRQAAGRAGALQASAKRGRPAGIRRGSPTGGARLNVIETLRAAAPWQRLRASPSQASPPGATHRIEIRHGDLRITRLKQRTETTTIFVVDASGSLAVNRLAEAKGAVELLLAECYVRRVQVALLAFRGRSAEVLLPPTRSHARAKRSLSALPGGGSTPLAAGIDAALLLADQLRRRGQTPVVVFITDGRANVARDGSTGRAVAEADARQAAKAAAATGVRMLVVDAAPRPQPPARALAEVLGALYLPLPRADAGGLSQAVRTAAGTP